MIVAPQPGRLSFESFDLKKILTECAYLMGSQGLEYDVDEDNLGKWSVTEEGTYLISVVENFSQ